MAKALNTKNLVPLGAARLADLLMEVTKGRADLQRRLRLELSAHQGPEDVARDLRKRYAAIRQAKGYIPRKTHRTLAKELRSFLALIDGTIAPANPDLAFDLLWELLYLAPGVLARGRDAAGILAQPFEEVMPLVARLAPALSHPAEGLADLVFDAVRQDTGGRFDGSVAALAPALGAAGLARLDRLASDATSASKIGRARLLVLRRAIAAARGDVDAYIALFTTAQRADPATALDIAARLMDAERPEEALAHLDHAPRTPVVEDGIIAALAALKRKEALAAFLRDSFAARPDADRLRAHLRLLPDFEDIEAEDAARRLAQDHPDRNAALAFFMDWPDHDAAARLILTHPDALNGHASALPTYADALVTRAPLAAVILWRKAIRAGLGRGTAAEDRQAAARLLACAEADARIVEYDPVPDHLSFVASLRRTYGRRKAFWARVQ
ncbi:DUF6880 family protein [Falsirhodobacter halotolerans]|uniref:DUF6880 family protein n=1 Tax=Falsirhodobacter halotolerans TaxID=1146892 RepID=UPI001FD29B7C|nr:DUF6880 family protein [Falsirhodobacter halotolerans]MCJ8140016.1 hypothetical protein [Falsirhodobacter halotolerans]